MQLLAGNTYLLLDEKGFNTCYGMHGFNNTISFSNEI